MLHTAVLGLVVAGYRSLTQVATNGRLFGPRNSSALSCEELVSVIRCNGRVRPIVNDLLDRVATIILFVVLLDV